MVDLSKVYSLRPEYTYGGATGLNTHGHLPFSSFPRLPIFKLPIKKEIVLGLLQDLSFILLLRSKSLDFIFFFNLTNSGWVNLSLNRPCLSFLFFIPLLSWIFFSLLFWWKGFIYVVWVNWATENTQLGKGNSVMRGFGCEWVFSPFSLFLLLKHWHP